MTEEEAKTKWCPSARNQFDGVDGRPACNMRKDDRYNIRIKCIASDCMMWKWNSPSAEAVYEVLSRGESTVDFGGHCGLTGGHNG